MNFQKTKIEGVYIITPEVYEDERGYFLRTFCKQELEKEGIAFEISQANRSFTKKKGTIRGLHFQQNPHWEGKIVQCTKGEIYNVVLDLRSDSKTFGEWISEKIGEKDRKMILTPKGCANGFQSLTDDCQLEYFMSEFYVSSAGSGVRWNDPAFNIKWPLEPTFISEKDKNWPDYNSRK